jgi:hypothetical protein
MWVRTAMMACAVMFGVSALALFVRRALRKDR